jgi:hypothetical protein
VILARDFVFVHVPKTGGNFVREILERHAPPAWRLQKLADHATVAEIPKSHLALPRLAFVRNPYDWYVSWYHFQQQTRSDFFVAVSDDGRLPFAAAMRRALTSNDALLRGQGPFTQTLKSLLGEGLEGVRIGRMERMREDLQRLLAEVVEVPPAMAAAILSLPPQNVSVHQHYSRYYDQELRRLIWEKDHQAFEFLGYAWEEPRDGP